MTKTFRVSDVDIKRACSYISEDKAIADYFHVDIDRVTELRAQLRAVAAAADSGLRTAIGSAYAWCALADQRARHTLDASPREYVDARFDPLRRTIAAWRAAVACRRGRIPAALMEPA